MDRRSKSVSLPSEDTLNAARKGLPFFESYDTRKLLADAAKANNGIASDAAITAMYNQHCRAQLVQLLRALGCDPKDKQFWPKALIKLATLHHNLGRLVHRQSSRRTAKTWTAQDESILLCGVYELVQTGLSEREAVRTIADAKVSRITSDDLGNGHPAKLREVRAKRLFGASISECGSDRRDLTR
jgi:hypothetical protein